MLRATRITFGGTDRLDLSFHLRSTSLRHEMIEINEKVTCRLHDVRPARKTARLRPLKLHSNRLHHLTQMFVSQISATRTDYNELPISIFTMSNDSDIEELATFSTVQPTFELDNELHVNFKIGMYNNELVVIHTQGNQVHSYWPLFASTELSAHWSNVEERRAAAALELANTASQPRLAISETAQRPRTVARTTNESPSGSASRTRSPVLHMGTSHLVASNPTRLNAAYHPVSAQGRQDRASPSQTRPGNIPLPTRNVILDQRTGQVDEASKLITAFLDGFDTELDERADEAGHKPIGTGLARDRFPIPGRLKIFRKYLKLYARNSRKNNQASERRRHLKIAVRIHVREMSHLLDEETSKNHTASCDQIIMGTIKGSANA